MPQAILLLNREEFQAILLGVGFAVSSDLEVMNGHTLPTLKHFLQGAMRML